MSGFSTFSQTLLTNDSSSLLVPVVGAQCGALLVRVQTANGGHRRCGPIGAFRRPNIHILLKRIFCPLLGRQVSSSSAASDFAWAPLALPPHVEQPPCSRRIKSDQNKWLNGNFSLFLKHFFNGLIIKFHSIFSSKRNPWNLSFMLFFHLCCFFLYICHLCCPKF